MDTRVVAMYNTDVDRETHAEWYTLGGINTPIDGWIDDGLRLIHLR
jgi:hypothetical protein